MATLEEVAAAITPPVPATELDTSNQTSSDSDSGSPTDDSPSRMNGDESHDEIDTGAEENLGAEEEVKEEDGPPEGDDEDDKPPLAAGSEEDFYLDISDDDLFEVKIDGELVYRSVSDAKKALSGEGAVGKRLHEVSEQRAEVEATHQRNVQELETQRTALNDFATQLDTYLFKPQVREPDAAIRQSDPATYLNQVDAYQLDQTRINTAKQQMAKNLQDNETQKVQQQQQRRAYNETQLVAKIPDLATPEKAKGIMDTIVQVGRDYGFSDTEIGELFDHRSFKMAHDLATFLNAQKTVNVEVIKNEQATKNPRRLRSGVARRMTAAKQSAKARTAIVAQAQKSGKVDDIAAMITKPGRRN